MPSTTEGADYHCRPAPTSVQMHRASQSKSGTMPDETVEGRNDSKHPDVIGGGARNGVGSAAKYFPAPQAYATTTAGRISPVIYRMISDVARQIRCEDRPVVEAVRF